MVKFCCQCLNVTVSTKTTDLNLKETSISDPGGSLDLLLANLTEVQLGLEGIHNEHPYLVRTQKMGDWALSKCICCGCMTHATHNVPGSGKVLLNKDAMLEASNCESLLTSPNYCPLFKIIMPNSNINQPVECLGEIGPMSASDSTLNRGITLDEIKGVQSERYDSLNKVLDDIQRTLNTFLANEETAMEERIKCYIESQRKTYGELQSRVHRNKNTLVNLVLRTEKRLSESQSEDMIDSPNSPAQQNSDDEVEEAPPIVVKANPLSSASHTPDLAPTSQPKKFTSLSDRLKMSANAPRQSNEKKSSELDPDGDLDFDSAFQENSSQPFYVSDEENEDTDDSETEMRGRRPRDQVDMYSASVPISMPTFGRSANRKSYNEDQDEDDLLPQDAASMAASIKALAQSVHGDGTEMFGELPRPRRNTSNFGIS